MANLPVSPDAAQKNGNGRQQGSVSEWLRDRVDLCMYVQELDLQRDQNAAFVCDSYRKLKWRRSKQLRRQEESQHERNGSHDGEEEEARRHGQIAHGSTTVRHAVDENPNEELAAAMPMGVDDNDPFNILLGDVLRGQDVAVTCHGTLPARASDPLGAISVPCVREGNSLTLCCSEECGQQLVVFGGRVLRDTAVLLPRAVRTDPMKFERVRYTYSNSVYAFDVATSTWARRECSGREPRERSDHSALSLAPHHLVIFGGRGRNGQVFRDFFALSLSQWHWTQVETDAPPLERYWHSWCMSSDTEQRWQQEPSIFLFGGKSDTVVYGDLQQLPTARLKLLLAAAEGDEREAAEHKPQEVRRESDAARLLLKERELQKLPSWLVPQTVGKPPTSRFGMQVVALENEQLAVIGGWRVRKSKDPKAKKNRLLDVHILDLAVLVWSTPRLSTVMSAQPFVPSERLLFECFYAEHTLILFGGHTYVSNGETESFTACEDAKTLYKLDVAHMIWRRQEFPGIADSTAGPAATGALPAPHPHNSTNAIVNGYGFTCSSEPASLQLQLSKIEVRGLPA
ncbi:hypothetical protein BBJ28_00009589 [Nothophytophthora sp. Chile5]|nr:hypothetical protein BBJ28_00009589 [Nothophytophthora sp. Chile5]